jgi:Do/DeqQ family serine protease
MFTMNGPHVTPGRRAAQAGLATIVVALLSGATWHGLSADAPAPEAPQIASTTPASQAAIGGRTSYADVVKMVAPAVVTIQVEGRAAMAPTGFRGEDFERFFGEPFGEQYGQQFGDRFRTVPRAPQIPRQRGLGSGVVTTTDGYILTNHHVVEGARSIRVEFADRRTFDAKLVGSDPPSDLALLKIDAANLPVLPLGDSDAVQVGDLVLAVGNPLGIGQTVTMGIVSAKGRSTDVGDGNYEDFLQTDAPINQGNSGGALVNLRGELVGINSQVISPSQGNIGIGFAIPSNMVRHVMTELKSGGRVRRAQLGVTVQAVTSEMAESLKLGQIGGAIVSNVAPGSAAERAGVKRGDVIRSFNGQAVQDTNSLRNRVAEATPGARATLVVIRDGSEHNLTVTLGEAAAARQARGGAPGQPGADNTALGVSVAPLTAESADRAGLPNNTRGLIVQDVDPESRAASAGIRPGDVISEVNQKPVTTVEELRGALQSSADRPVLLLVTREGQTLFVTVRPS